MEMRKVIAWFADCPECGKVFRLNDCGTCPIDSSPTKPEFDPQTASCCHTTFEISRATIYYREIDEGSFQGAA
jgi:hypothetical protein